MFSHEGCQIWGRGNETLKHPALCVRYMAHEQTRSALRLQTVLRPFTLTVGTALERRGTDRQPASSQGRLASPGLSKLALCSCGYFYGWRRRATGFPVGAGALNLPASPTETCPLPVQLHPSRGGTAARRVSGHGHGCRGGGYGLRTLRDGISRKHCARACTLSIGASGDSVSQMACTPRDTLAPSSWVTPSWSTGNQHEKPPSARGVVVNSGDSNEKINAMVQHG